MRKAFSKCRCSGWMAVETELRYVAQTPEARQRLMGPVLLLVECLVEGALQEDSYYLAANPSKGVDAPLEIREGTRLDGAAIKARVLVCCRPPAVNFSSAATETSELLQV